MSRVFGSYILDERIGVGGMGEVYRATKSGPEGFEARVALKLILPHLAQEKSFRNLFSREARLAALLKHPNIVSVNGFDILEGTPFIEMEYVEGSDLASLLKNIREGDILPMEESAYILHSAARGLAYAHTFGQGPDGAAGIVHRDFNPHNLLISIEGEVKITDFGIARAAMGGTAASGTLMGKLAYMSPEQIEGKSLDHRSDLFSLGITAYQLLTGQHPFRRASEAGTVRAVQEASCRLVSEIAPSLPSSIAEIVDSLLSVSPVDRPGSAWNVADIFEEYLKPSSAKMLGQRAYDIAGTRPHIPENRPTGPTLPVQSKKHLAWLAALIILTMIVFMGFLKTGEPTVETGRISNERNPVNNAPAQTTEPPVTDIILDQVKVLLNTTPAGALVHEGDTVLGYTPLTVIIPSGTSSRELAISMERYEPAEISLTRNNSDKNVMVALTPLPTGTMRISAIPWARVTFMDKDMGVTPVVIDDTPVGKHLLVLSNDELGVLKEMKVNVREGVNPAFVVDMGTGKIVQGK